MRPRNRPRRFLRTLPFFTLWALSIAVLTSSAMGQEIRWYHGYSRDGFLGWYLPRGGQVTKHIWPVTLVWFDEAEFAWYYTSNSDVLSALQQLRNQNRVPADVNTDPTFTMAIHFNSAANDRGIASRQWVKLDVGTYLTFPGDLSAYLHKLGEVDPGLLPPEPRASSDPAPAAATSRLICCRAILDISCFPVELASLSPAPQDTHPPGYRPLEPCWICTVCCSTWGNACQGVHCEDQACLSYTAECNDDSACTSDSCDPDTGCEHENLCTGVQDCKSRQCVDRHCQWVNFPNGQPCPPDTSMCTEDKCQGGTCTHPQITCDDENECTTDTCLPATGCEFTDRPDGTGCNDDEDPCTEDVCAEGVCTHPPKVCDDDNECTYDGCDSETGACVNPPLPDGTPCPPDANECTSDHCEDRVCVHPDLPDGTPCTDDGDECTDDVCQNGSCAHPDIDCDDGRPCTVDTCDPETCAEDDCPCVYTCIPEPCGLSVETPVLTICPGGRANLEFETTNSSGCLRCIYYRLTDTSGGVITLESLPSPVWRIHQPGQTRFWSLPIRVDPDSPFGTGSIRLDIYAFGNGCPYAICASDTIAVTVVQLDLEIFNDGSDLDHGDSLGPQGPPVPDEDEESIGGYVLVNWDDDDADGFMNADGSWPIEPIPDLNENSVANEDNLAKLVATVSPLPSSGTLELEILQGAAKIRVWAQSEKGSEVLPGTTLKTWNLDDPAQRSEGEQYSAGGFWIEGVQASDTERDVAVNFRYRDPSGTTTCLDTVSVTVVMINLANAVYRDNDLWPERSRGHAAMVWKFVGPLTRANLDNDEFFRIIEMDGPTSTKTLTSIT